MTGVLGIGLAVGSGIIAFTGMPQRVMPIIIVASFVWDFGMIGFGFSRIYPLSLVLLFIMGVAGMFWVNAIINLFQRAAVGDMRGRVMSLYTIGMGAFSARLGFRRSTFRGHRQRNDAHRERDRWYPL